MYSPHKRNYSIFILTIFVHIPEDTGRLRIFLRTHGKVDFVCLFRHKSHQHVHSQQMFYYISFHIIRRRINTIWTVEILSSVKVELILPERSAQIIKSRALFLCTFPFPHPYNNEVLLSR